MNPTNQRTIATIILVIIVLLAGTFLVKRMRDTAGTGMAASPLASTSLDSLASSTATMSSGETAGQYVIAEETLTFDAKAGAKIPVPDFKNAVSCSLDATVCQQIQTKVAAAVEALSQKTNDFGAWINLGTLRKMVGDYKGAAEAWEYVSKIYPTQPTSFSNLGDLYMSYLHDNAKAETNYLTAIKNYPAGADAYRALAELYQSGFRGGSAAEDILKKGIKAAPQAIDLQVLLARYYTAAGRTADAAATYDAAIAAATAAGNTSLAASLEVEKAGK